MDDPREAIGDAITYFEAQTAHGEPCTKGIKVGCGVVRSADDLIEVAEVDAPRSRRLLNRALRSASLRLCARWVCSLYSVGKLVLAIGTHRADHSSLETSELNRLASHVFEGSAAPLNYGVRPSPVSDFSGDWISMGNCKMKMDPGRCFPFPF
jgi:hypothetical protein